MTTPLSYRTWPFYWVARVSGRYRRHMETRLESARLDMPRWRVLTTLNEDRIASVSEIASHASIKLPTMTRIIQRMESDGLVRRQPRPGKPWIMEVVLTPLGAEAGRLGWEEAKALYALAFAGFSDTDIAVLTDLLRRVAENLGGDEAS